MGKGLADLRTIRGYMVYRFNILKGRVVSRGYRGGGDCKGLQMGGGGVRRNRRGSELKSLYNLISLLPPIVMDNQMDTMYLN